MQLQAALSIAPPSCSLLPPTAKLMAFSIQTSVFPAEACDTVGGEACDVEMYPEVKLKPEAKKGSSVTEPVEREYLQYDSPKTVFPAEACDDLGGEFCDPEYQKGVY
uniref:Cytokinin-repressed protein CR9 n=1 Tax=Cucumis melo subsp. melo TaxID=412675 RepID=E5GB60_CUCME|nr:cytokinin-repressed protein CR9 [Cucumis melo subsp. melo]